MQPRTLTAALAGAILALGMTTADAQTHPAPTNAPKAGTDAMSADGSTGASTNGAKAKAKKSRQHRPSHKSGALSDNNGGDMSGSGKVLGASGGGDASKGSSSRQSGSTKQSQ